MRLLIAINPKGISDYGYILALLFQSRKLSDYTTLNLKEHKIR